MRMETDVAVQLEKPEPAGREERAARAHAHLSIRIARNTSTPTECRRALTKLSDIVWSISKAPQVEDDVYAAYAQPSEHRGDRRVAHEHEHSARMRHRTRDGYRRIAHLHRGARKRSHSDRYRRQASSRYLDDLSSRCARRLRACRFSSTGCKTLFDPKRYPWFADEFIHPRELAGASRRRMRQFRTPSVRRWRQRTAPRCAS